MAMLKFKFVEHADVTDRPQPRFVREPELFSPVPSPALDLQSQIEAILAPMPAREAKYPRAVRAVLPLVLSGLLWTAFLSLW